MLPRTLNDGSRLALPAGLARRSLGRDDIQEDDSIGAEFAVMIPVCKLPSLASALLLLFGIASASAQTPAEFFKGKQIALLIGFGPGGEDDLWGHLVARHLTAHLPGNPAVVAQNAPGSGGLLVANRIYNTAPKDGTAIGMINRGIPFEPLLGGQGTQFDPLQMNYIGSPGRDTTVCAAHKDAPVKSMDDLYTRELTVGGTGSGADTAVYPEFLSALLGMKFRLVKGYRGSNEIQLAIERGEVQGICLAYDSLMRGNLARRGEINVLLQAALAPDPRVHAPIALDAARSAEDRQSLELFFARAAVGRPFVAPPGVPADRLAVIRQAFAAMLRDPAFIDEAKRLELNVVPIGAQKILNIITKAYAAPPDIVRRTMRALGRAS
ncbi:MAG TPA: tripartite tricarboxylate transporter substrate-binding protein [Xanthobacteraceae bacterium]|jgi:tripartite-type tricarboxylate transporter receptor subunit TctC